MTNNDELSKLIAAAENEVKSNKTQRDSSLQGLLKGEDKGTEKVAPEEPKTTGSVGKDWDDWKLGMDPEDTDEAKKRSLFANVCILLIILIFAIGLIKFHMSSLQDEKNRKSSSNLPLSTVQVGQKIEEPKKSDKDFSGVKDGISYHKGIQTSVDPGFNTGQLTVVEERKRHREQRLKEFIKKSEDPEANRSAGDDNKTVKDLPPDAPEHIKELYREKEKERAEKGGKPEVNTGGPNIQLQ